MENKFLGFASPFSNEAGDLLWGIWLKDVISPYLEYFTKDGFAQLLAVGLVSFAFCAGVWIYVRHIWYGKRCLRSAYKAVSKIDTQEYFTENYNTIDEALKKNHILRHGWSEFTETLVMPQNNQDFIQVIRNTIRPNYYLNTHEVEASLKLNRLHFLSNFLIGIGLLLTFVGLVAALTKTGAAMDVKGADLQEPLKELIKVAAFKFWTSVAGLLSSLGLRLFYEVQHHSIKNILRKINTKIELGLQFVTPENIAIQNLREAEEQSAAMKRFSTDVAVSFAEKMQPIFTNALSPLNDSLKDIEKSITGGMSDVINDSAGKEMTILSQNLVQIIESLNASKVEMDSMGTTFRIAMSEAAEALKSASGEASGEMSRQLQEVITTLAEENRKQAHTFDDTMKRLSSAMDQAGENAGVKVEQAAGNLASGMNGISDGVRDAAGSMAERMNSLSMVLQTIEERMSSHIRAMDSLTGRAQDTEKAMGVTSRHLSEAAQPVMQATNKIASTVQQLHSSIETTQKTISESHQSLISLSSKMNETQQSLQNVWQAYDKRFASVDESLAKAVAGIVDNVRDNMKSMEKFVADMDKNLGKSVDVFRSSISELTDVAENFGSASDKLLQSVDKMAN